MSGIFIAFIAQIAFGLSLIFDKILLQERFTEHPRTYVFWIGSLNVFLLFLLPFISIPSTFLILVSLLTGAVTIAGLFFYYATLKLGEVSQVLPVVGAFTPIATALFGILLLNTPLNVAQQIAFILLVIGGFVMFLSEKVHFRKVLPFIVLASIFFGLSSVLTKVIYNNTADFFNGFMLINLGVFVASLSFLIVPTWRKEIFHHSSTTPKRNQVFYFGNRLLASLAALMVSYAVKLEHPALIDATSSLRYVVIFLIVFVMTEMNSKWIKEKFSGWTLVGKIIATLIIATGLLGLGLQSYYQALPILDNKDISWGVTFSKQMSESFNVDWRETYTAIMSDLRPAGVRILAPWDLIEPKQDVMDFADLDWQVQEANRYGVPVIIALGQKVPRWPECHTPEWAREFLTKDRQFKNDEAKKEYRAQLLEYMRGVVLHYRDTSNLLYFQVENEAFFKFGECPLADEDFFKEEVALVKMLDPVHPILSTDSGEFGNWSKPARVADVFGTTLYRRVYNDNLQRNLSYPLTPEFYPLKVSITKFLTGKPDQKFISAEVGMEPWSHKQIWELPVEQQKELLSVDDFRKNIEFARNARFDTNYFWGVEWWYYMKSTQNSPEYWNEIKVLTHAGEAK